ncbi:unnamed protein product, partial [Effrenium voratum]
ADHGPFGGGTNQNTKVEACALWVKRMTETEFLNIQEQMMYDRSVLLDEDRAHCEHDIPQCAEELMQQAAITTRSIFAQG